MKLTSLVVAAALVACQSPTPRPATTTVEPSSGEQPAAASTKEGASSAAFGFDRVAEACASFSAHITNADRTSYLDIHVDVKSLGLEAGAHDLPVVTPGVELKITQLADPHEGEWSCTDFGGGPRSPITKLWRTTGGTLRIRLYAPKEPATAQEGDFDRVDVELVDVRFTDDAGQTRTVDVKFADLGIGWLPG